MIYAGTNGAKDTEYAIPCDGISGTTAAVIKGRCLKKLIPSG